MLAQRLHFGPSVREALRFTFERWNGHGFPAGATGEDIPLAMRTVHLAHDMEAIGRLFSPAKAIDAARERRDRTYDPALADLFVAHGARWFERLAKLDPWDAVLELEQTPRRTLDGVALDEALEVAADFIDLKSPYMAGHSRRCAKRKLSDRVSRTTERAGPLEVEPVCSRLSCSVRRGFPPASYTSRNS